MNILENSTKLERNIVGESEGLNAYLLLHLKNITISRRHFSLITDDRLGNNPINNWVDFPPFMNISDNPFISSM